jgi:hypothetical protein
MVELHQLVVEASVGRRAPLGPLVHHGRCCLILFVPGLIGLIELVTRDGSSGRPFPSDCPTVPPTGVTAARCLEFPFSTGP